MSSSWQPLTLALGGGGVKSVSCAGVLAVLEEAGLPIGPLVGVSGGGVVAILYGAGYTPTQIRDVFHDINLAEVWEPDPDRQALFGATRIRARFAALVGGATFADLKRPAVAMAMDLHTEQPVWMDSGPLVDALTATMAIPGLFRGVARGEQLLVDGGPVSPLPVGPARELGPRVVAIDVLHHRSPEEFNHVLESRGPMRYAGLLTKQFGLNVMVNRVYQTASSMTRRLSDYAAQLHPPDVLLRPEVGKVGLFAFDLSDYAYAQGETAARAALPQLIALAQPVRPSIWKRVSARSREFWNRRVRPKRKDSHSG
jgi:NTE family protein